MHVLAQLLFLAGLVHGVRVDGVRVDAFVNWCTERGVTGFSPPGIVSIASTPTSGLGVFATAHVGAGEEILRVPMRLAISDRLLVGLDYPPHRVLDDGDVTGRNTHEVGRPVGS